MEKVTKVTLTPYVVDGTLVPASEETNAITTEAYVGEYCDWDLSESCGPCPDPNCDTCNPGHDSAIRPQALTVEQWHQLATLMAKYTTNKP